MYKAITCALIAILMLATIDFDKENRPTPYELENQHAVTQEEFVNEPQNIYAFEGECDQFTLTDGEIRLNPSMENTEEEIIRFGELTVKGTQLSDVTAYTTHFYLMLGDDEKHTVDRAIFADASGVQSGDLGQKSTKEGILGAKNMPGNALIGNFYLDLTVTYENGQEETFTMPLTVTQVNNF